MKNEDFDDAIRKKLESLNQTYAESEIDKVYHQVMSKRRFQWKGSNGSWLMYSLAAAAIIVVTLWSVSHFSGNKKIASKYDTLNQQVLPGSIDSTSHTDDSIHTVKLVPSKKMIDSSEDTTSKYNITSKNTETEIKSQDIAVSQPFKMKPVKQEAAVSKPVSKALNTTIQTAEPFAVATENPVQSINYVNTDTISVVPDSNQGKEIQNVNETIPSAKLEPLNKDTEPVVIQQQNEKNFAVDANKPLESTKPIANVTPDTTESVAKKEFSLFKGATFRPGAEFSVSNQSFGTGTTGELLLKNHLAFETGLTYKMYQPEKYEDKADMLGNKHHDFNHRIEDHFSDKDHISEISISNRLLQIPIAFNYYVPFKRNYRLSFSLGTDIDIYLNQKLNYTNQGDSARHDKGNFRAKGNVTPFNNIVISAGLEKQWGSWIFNVTPVLTPRLKQVFYKPEELEFGVGVGIKYGFGK